MKTNHYKFRKGLFVIASLFACVAANAATYYIGGTLGALNATGGGSPLGGSITAKDGQSAGWTSIWDLSTAPVDATTGRHTVTLLPGNNYILENVVFVTGGDLKLNNGTIVRGQPQSAAGALDAGSLAIANGARIYATGLANDPVIFTSSATSVAADSNRASGATPSFYDNDPKNNPKRLVVGGVKQNGKWGGLMILGKAPTNIDRNLRGSDNGGASGGAYDDAGRVSFQDEQGGTINTDDRADIEGIPVTSVVYAAGLDRYGGNVALDNSGILNYVSLRYCGSNLSLNSEINGVTLGGVGAGTFIDYIEVFGCTDDMIEIFGGTVNLTHAVVMGGEDDLLDLDAGWTGFVQFYLGIGWGKIGGLNAGADYTDRLIEWDGAYRFERPEGFRVTPVASQAINTGGIGASTANGPVGGGMVLNATFIANNYTGPATNWTTTSAGGDNNDHGRGIMIRDQASPVLLNSIIIPGGVTNNAGAYGLRVATRDPEDFTASIKRLESGRARIEYNTFYRGGWSTAAQFVGTGFQTAAGANGATRTDAPAARIIAVIGNNTFNVNPFDPGIYGGPNNTLTEDLSSGFIDPRPVDGYAQGSGFLVAPVPAGSGAVQTSYRGAFSDDFGGNLWTTGWTAANKLGLIVDGI